MGSPSDISPLLCFSWLEPVYYRIDDSAFPSDTHEGYGRFVGFAENVGHLMTFKILTDDTQRVIPRSHVRSALNANERNLRLDPLNDNDTKDQLRKFVRSFNESAPGFSSNDGESSGLDPSSVRESREPSAPSNSTPVFHPSKLRRGGTACCWTMLDGAEAHCHVSSLLILAAS